MTEVLGFMGHKIEIVAMENDIFESFFSRQGHNPLVRVCLFFFFCHFMGIWQGRNDKIFRGFRGLERDVGCGRGKHRRPKNQLKPTEPTSIGRFGKYFGRSRSRFYVEKNHILVYRFGQKSDFLTDRPIIYLKKKKRAVCSLLCCCCNNFEGQRP